MQCVNFLMDLPSGLSVEFLKRFLMRKKVVRQFFDRFDAAYRLLVIPEKFDLRYVSINIFSGEVFTSIIFRLLLIWLIQNNC